MSAYFVKFIVVCCMEWFNAEVEINLYSGDFNLSHFKNNDTADTGLGT